MSTADDASAHRRPPPRQARGRARFDAILDAAEATIAVRGFERATTNHIAEAAGVSVGSLYRWFPDKTAIADSLVERAVADIAMAADQAFDAHHLEPTPVLLRGVLRAIAAAWLARPALAPLVATSLAPSAPSAPGAPLRDALLGRAGALLELRVPGISESECDLVARMCIGLLEGALLEAASDPARATALIDEAAYAIAAYLAMKYPFASSHRWTEPMPDLPPSRPSIQ